MYWFGRVLCTGLPTGVRRPSAGGGSAVQMARKGIHACPSPSRSCSGSRTARRRTPTSLRLDHLAIQAAGPLLDALIRDPSLSSYPMSSVTLVADVVPRLEPGQLEHVDTLDRFAYSPFAWISSHVDSTGIAIGFAEEVLGHVIGRPAVELATAPLREGRQQHGSRESSATPPLLQHCGFWLGLKKLNVEHRFCNSVQNLLWKSGAAPSARLC